MRPLERRATFLLLALLVAACADLRELWSLRSALADRFGERAMSINLQNRSDLSIVLENSPRASQPDSQRAAYARAVAEFVRDYYSGFDRLRQVTIVFAETRSAGPAKVTEQGVSYRFTPADLRASRAKADTIAK